MTSSNLPYHAGYAKSSRGACQKCDVHIEEGTLRIADSQTSKFFHFDCFFETHQPMSVKEIEHFGELKQDDQDKIQKKIKNLQLKKDEDAELQNLPYHAGYAKTSKGACKKCAEDIKQGTLRMADTQYHHFDCFFEAHKPTTIKEINHFEELKQEDQDKVQKKIKSLHQKNDEETVLQSMGNEVSYAKSGRSTCRGCHEKIPEGDIRISHKKFDAHVTRGHGPQDQFYHVQCFKEHRKEFGLTESIEVASGFSDLNKDDQEQLVKQLPALEKNRKHKNDDASDDSEDGPDEPKREKKENDGDAKKKIIKTQEETLKEMKQKNDDGGEKKETTGSAKKKNKA